MNFKIDENLPTELADDLRQPGHDADTVLGEGLRGAKDPAVVEAARASDRILFTLDKGIAGVVLFRPDTSGQAGSHVFRADKAFGAASDGTRRPADRGRSRPNPVFVSRSSGSLCWLEQGYWYRGQSSFAAVAYVIDSLINRSVKLRITNVPDLRRASVQETLEILGHAFAVLRRQIADFLN